VPPRVVAREIGPTVGVIESGPPDADSTVVLMGGDPDWIARYLASLPFPFEVLSPDEVRHEVAALGRRLLRAGPASVLGTESVATSEDDGLRRSPSASDHEVERVELPRTEVRERRR
jgi:hypothetical protein